MHYVNCTLKGGKQLLKMKTKNGGIVEGIHLYRKLTHNKFIKHAQCFLFFSNLKSNLNCTCMYLDNY